MPSYSTCIYQQNIPNVHTILIKVKFSSTLASEVKKIKYNSL